MATKGYAVTAVSVAVRNDGANFVLLQSNDNAWAGERWWALPAPAGQNSAFLATALTIISGNLPSQAWMDDRLQEYDPLVQLAAQKH